MRSTTHNIRQINLILLYLYQEKIGKVDVRRIANKFIATSDSRKERFSLLQVSSH